MLLHTPTSLQPRYSSNRRLFNVCGARSGYVRRGGVSLVQVKASKRPISDKASNAAVATQQQQQQHDSTMQVHRALGGASGAAATKASGTSSSNNVVTFRRRLAAPVIPDSSSSSSSSAVVADTSATVPTTMTSSSSSSRTTTTTTSSSSSSSSSSSCPFMHALQPPLVKLSWWQRIWQLTQPMKMQHMVLHESVAAGGSVVQLEQQLAFEAAYVPGTGAAVRHVLAGDSGSEPYTGPSLVPFFVRLIGEDSLLVVSGPRHKYLRALLAPAFNPDAVAGYTPQIVQLAQRHLQDWAAAGEDGVQGLDALKLLTFEFIVQLTFGCVYEGAELQSLHTSYKEWINGLPAWPWLNIPFTPYAAALTARDVMMQHFQVEVAAARAKMEEGAAVGGLLGDMLAAVDENGSRLSDSQICDNILLMLFAGHDTSSTTLTLCLSNLQDHPAAMQQLRDEQAAVVAKHGDDITAAALKDMHYAEAVIKETLRRDPVVAMLFRVALRDFELAGYTVPQGRQLLLPIKYLSAQDSRWSKKTGDVSPDAFVPERMLTPEGQKAGDLMPFGHGARYCLGSGLAMSEMKVLLALLARHYSFEADNNTEWINSIGKVPKNGLPLVVRPLQQ